MPMCGFNGKMLQGLKDLQEGLVEHGLYGRSRETGQTVEQRLQEELEDMKRFSKEVGNLKDPEMRDLVSGLSAFAGAFYRLARRKGLDGYKETAQAVSNYFLEMDRKYYGELQGQPNDMQRLAEHLNGVNV